MFSLESPHRGISNEYKKHAIINIKRKSHIIIQNILMSAAKGFFSKGLKNEFETAMVNEPLVFEPLKFYCICIFKKRCCIFFSWMYICT